MTPQGTITAENVLVATNGYTDEAAREIGQRVFPLGSYMIATEPLPAELAAKLIPQRRVVFDSKHYLYYFRLSADNRMLFGGRADYKPRYAGIQSQERRDFAARHGEGLP